MIVKVCGLTDQDQVQTCIDHGADFCGFILNYKKSHRYLEQHQLEKLLTINRHKTKFVGVLVKPSLEELDIFSRLGFDYFQIYECTDEQIKTYQSKYQTKIIAALKISQATDVLNYMQYKHADYLLFDSTGMEKTLSWDFDWIKKVPTTVKKFVAGGIAIDHYEKLSKINKLTKIAVDASGALETDKIKDLEKIKTFLKIYKKDG